LYRLAPSPTIPLPPLANAIKVIVNWVGPAARLAKNIWYLTTSGSVTPDDPAMLKTVADQIMTQLVAANVASQFSGTHSIASVTCKDAGGTSAQATSTHAPIVGSNLADPLPPQSAVVVSWKISASYRGGKPRTYLFGIPSSAVNPTGSSTLTPTFASNTQSKWEAFKNALNAWSPGTGGTITMGTISYHSGHAVRPTPIFRVFTGSEVHERLDSQRRRSGPESAFGEMP
jgi:hypothetical protein